MKVLWISQNIPYPPKTGVLQRNYNLLREVAKHADIHLLAIFKENVIPVDYDVEEATRELLKFCKQLEIVRLPIESSALALYGLAFTSLFTRDPLSINWAKSKIMAQQLQAMLNQTDFDVIHFDTISLAVYKDVVGDIPKVLNHHNIESHLLQRRTLVEQNPLKRFYFSLEGKKLEQFETRTCPQFDMNFTVSELDKDRLLEFAPGTKADVIANGVDIEYFSPQAVETKPGSVIMVSGMNWYPNRDAVLYMYEEIWPKLCEVYPDISWVVVGASPPKQLLDLAEQDKRVTVTGFVDDVRPYLAEAEIYLCPMRDGGGTRLKILDALSMGKPIVSTTMGVEGIAVTPEKNVLTADTPDEFVKQIGRLRDDPALRQQIGQAGRQFVIDTYSWEIIGKKLANIYQSLTKEKT